MLRVLLIISATVGVSAHGSGTWLDTHHATSMPNSGTRFIAESPPHVLTMVGTDDGHDYWTLKGWCSGDDMTNIHFDFSPKGGPANLVGKWTRYESGRVEIMWPDGNAWVMVGESSDVKFGAIVPGKAVAESKALWSRPSGISPGFLGGAVVGALLMALYSKLHAKKAAALDAHSELREEGSA